MKAEVKVLEKGIFELSCKAGEIIEFSIPYKPGFDYNRIRHIRVDCNCTSPEIWQESIRGKYHDDGKLEGLKQSKTKFLYVFYDREGIKPEEADPTFVVTEANESVPNWEAKNLLWEPVELVIMVSK